MDGPVPLIVLPGALGALDGGELPALLTVKRAVRVIAYRADDTLAGLTARVLATADCYGAERFDLLGQSYGGWIAQCIARIWPERVRRLVLAHSFALAPSHGRRFRLGRRLLTGLPRRLARRLLLKRAGRALAPVAAADPGRHRGLIEALERRTLEPDFFAMLAAQQDCLAHSLAPAMAALPPVAPSVPVLILESADDPLIGERDRAELRRLLPNARVHRFEGAGHVSALAAPDAFAAVVAAFLDQAGPLATGESDQGR